jgi:hypothetical protein
MGVRVLSAFLNCRSFRSLVTNASGHMSRAAAYRISGPQEVETGPGLILQAITSPTMIQVATLVAARKSE